MSLEGDLSAISELLMNDLPLEPRHNDHELTGEWKDFRDCHIRPDLLLIYQKIGLDVVRFVRLVSHSTLDMYGRVSPDLSEHPNITL